MSNNIGVIIASLILSLTYIGSEYFQTQQLSRVPLASVPDVFHLRTECGELGQKLLKENSLPPNLSHSYQSNYNVKTNRCYVELSIFSADGSDSVANYELYDAQTNEILATLQTQRSPPSGAITDQNYHKLIPDQTFSEVDNYIAQKMADSREK